jgi:hypothetical protein
VRNLRALLTPSKGERYGVVAISVDVVDDFCDLYFGNKSAGIY